MRLNLEDLWFSFFVKCYGLGIAIYTFGFSYANGPVVFLIPGIAIQSFVFRYAEGSVVFLITGIAIQSFGFRYAEGPVFFLITGIAILVSYFRYANRPNTNKKWASISLPIINKKL